MTRRAINKTDADDQWQRVPEVPGHDVGEEHGGVSQCDLELSWLSRPIRRSLEGLRPLLLTSLVQQKRRRQPVDLKGQQRR